MIAVMPGSRRLNQLIASCTIAFATRTIATPASSVELSKWELLNTTVEGRLHVGTPVSLPCFSRFDGRSITWDPEACSVVQAEYLNPAFRSSHFGAYMQTQWETCQSTSQQCLLDNSNPTNPLAFNGTFACSQGGTSPFYIDVRKPSDIQAAYMFSLSTGVQLVVKNSGHDHKGRSSSKDTLALWTRNLNTVGFSSPTLLTLKHTTEQIVHVPSFVPEGCEDSYNAMTIGAGAAWQDVYNYAESTNVTMIGGYHQTVGASGGWLMGGGHSVLSPVYGLGVDRVVQIKIVTPDGMLRTANACQNADLFWALRGGGGGTFGVVLESTQIVEKQLTLQVASLRFTQTSENMREFYKLIVDNSIKWGTEGWGGHIRTTTLTYVTPTLSLDEAKGSMKPVSDWILRQNGTVVIETLPSWNSFFLKYVTTEEAPVGSQGTLGTRLIPSANFMTDEGKTALVDVLVNMLPFSLPYVGVVTPVLHHATDGATSVTPAWRKSLWHLGFHAGWQFNSSVEEKRTIYALVSNITKTMRDIAPNSGTYCNEGDVYEPNHEVSFWGSDNYSRLLQLKRKYDPRGLLTCWQCVGWSGASDQRFDCYL